MNTSNPHARNLVGWHCQGNTPMPPRQAQLEDFAARVVPGHFHKPLHKKMSTHIVLRKTLFFRSSHLSVVANMTQRTNINFF